MPRDGWNDWRSFPTSGPIPTEGGLVTSKQRGPMAESWWSRRFTEVLESYGLGGRMQRGRRYARTGQVIELAVSAGTIAAQVQGSRPTPYLVTISLPEPTAEQWTKVDAAMAARVGFAAQLLAGEVPPDLEDVFESAGVPLFPASWPAIRAACNCPDWGNPCKHVAAVFYLFADQLDTDPWLLLAWRGRTREQVLEPLGISGRGGPATSAGEQLIAPWWPFSPGPLPALAIPERPASASPLLVDRADAVLDAMESVAVEIGGRELPDLLRPLYQHLVGQARLPDDEAGTAAGSAPATPPTAARSPSPTLGTITDGRSAPGTAG